MIRYLKMEEKQETLPLYREAFPEDSEQFLEYYYREKGKDNQILAEKEPFEGGSRIVSMLHRNPYKLQVRDRIWKSDYIVAVATAEDCRRRGLMRSLLVHMMGDMYQEGMEFCFLMPADRRIYEPFDFAYIYDQPHWTLTEEAGKRMNLRRWNEKEGEIGEIADWMNQWLKKQYQVFARRTDGYVKRLMMELESENGWLEVLGEGTLNGKSQKENDKCGLNGLSKRGHDWLGIRCWWGREKTEQRLLYSQEGYMESAGEPTPAIMARIIHLRNFLKVIGLKKEGALSVRLTVEDRFCRENDGTFLWNIRKDGSELFAWETGMTAEKTLDMKISELTQWLFGYGNGTYKTEPWMERIQVLERVFLDEVV